MSILEKILGGLAAPVTNYLNERQKLRSAERIRKAELADALHKRQCDLISQGLHADAEWELESLRAHAGGWKDEGTWIIFNLPFVLAFIPPAAPHVLNGFKILEQYPAWALTVIISVNLAVFGIRWFRRSQSDT